MNTSVAMRSIALPTGDSAPVLGQGTWHMAEHPARHDDEVAALRVGLDLGMTLIDTAELYTNGLAEALVGEAIAGRRDEVFLVGKVLPNHATRQGTVDACRRSLDRLGTDWLDLYLLHWRGNVPLEATVEGFQALQRDGLIRQWGVSNFDLSDLQELLDVDGGEDVATDQVLYNLKRRGIEYDLLPWCNNRGVPIMAYSPIEQGRMLDDPTLQRVAARHHATPAQVALAWLLQHPRIIAIPKAGTPEHVQENRAALDVRLGQEDLIELDLAFPPPAHKVALEML